MGRSLTAGLAAVGLCLATASNAGAYTISAEPRAPSPYASALICYAPCTITAEAAPGERPEGTSGPLHWFVKPPGWQDDYTCRDDCYRGMLHEEEGDRMTYHVAQPLLQGGYYSGAPVSAWARTDPPPPPEDTWSPRQRAWPDTVVNVVDPSEAPAPLRIVNRPFVRPLDYIVVETRKRKVSASWSELGTARAGGLKTIRCPRRWRRPNRHCLRVTGGIKGTLVPASQFRISVRAWSLAQSLLMDEKTRTIRSAASCTSRQRRLGRTRACFRWR